MGVQVRLYLLIYINWCKHYSIYIFNKTQNILLCENGMLKLCDFGSAMGHVYDNHNQYTSAG